MSGSPEARAEVRWFAVVLLAVSSVVMRRSLQRT